MTKTRRFRASLGHLISKYNFMMFIKRANLTQKQHVFVVMYMNLGCIKLSVSRFGDFLKFWVKNYVTKVA